MDDDPPFRELLGDVARAPILEVWNGAAPTRPRKILRVVAWNMERGRHWEGGVRLVRETEALRDPDIVARLGLTCPNDGGPLSPPRSTATALASTGLSGRWASRTSSHLRSPRTASRRLVPSSAATRPRRRRRSPFPGRRDLRRWSVRAGCPTFSLPVSVAVRWLRRCRSPRAARRRTPGS